jgi:tRNA (mo5U34)-methyltransferase
MPRSEELQAQADDILWFHTIDLGDGVVTRGASELQMPASQFPSFEGKSVLDIGAWDGGYSFMAERGGAQRVVALDHYAWGVDIEARGDYWNQCAADGTLPDQSRDLTDFWRPDLPGRRGFEFAAAALDSKVETVVTDFATTDLAELGVFDVVLYLGVLYHMKEPLTCLERVRAVTGEVAVIETLALHLQGLEDQKLLQFYAGGEVNQDFGNWYAPTMSALHALCLAAGFSSVRTIQGPPAGPTPKPPSFQDRLGRRLQTTEHRGQVSPPSTYYRAIVHAVI